MMIRTVSILALCCLAQAAAAQTGRGAVISSGTPVSPGEHAPATQVGNCTDVQVGSARSYDCVNAKLGAVAGAAPRASSDWNAPVSSSSPSNVVGTFNEAATRARLGPNFGRSAVPFRPAPANPPAFPASPR